MATDEVRIPTVTAEEKDLSTARVVVVIPGMEVKKTSLFGGTKEPDKNAKVDVKFETRSLEVTAEITDKKGKVTKFRYKANKLPGDVNVEKCKKEFKKEQVILTLVKSEEYSWAVQLSKSGLDQAPDAE